MDIPPNTIPSLFCLLHFCTKSPLPLYIHLNNFIWLEMCTVGPILYVMLMKCHPSPILEFLLKVLMQCKDRKSPQKPFLSFFGIQDMFIAIRITISRCISIYRKHIKNITSCGLRTFCNSPGPHSWNLNVFRTDHWSVTHQPTHRYTKVMILHSCRLSNCLQQWLSLSFVQASYIRHPHFLSLELAVRKGQHYLLGGDGSKYYKSWL